MKKEYLYSISAVIFCILLGFGLIIINNGTPSPLSPGQYHIITQSTYLMMMVALFFIDIIAFLFMQLYFIYDRNNFSHCILGLAFLSCIIYLVLTIIIVQQYESDTVSVVSIHNSIMVHYFFRQLSFCLIIYLALCARNRRKNTAMIAGNKTIFLICFACMIILPVISYLISHQYFFPGITETALYKFDFIHIETYIKFIVFLWLGLVFSLFYTRAVNNDIWKGILLIAVSAVFYNIFVLFIVDRYMHLWYLSRMAEMFSKLIVVSVFIYHIFKVLQSTKQLSNLDPMTKIYNRNFFFEKINELLSTGETYSSGVFIIDIDHFKSVNDTWGHPAGDRVILAVVDILKQGIRATDILSRLGGEEFGIIINNMDPSKIKILAERLRRHVETQTNNTTLYNIPGGVTISIGVTLIRDKSLNASDIYNATDNALYKAKSSGRNKVAFSEIA